LHNRHLGHYQYRTSIWLPKPIEEIFNFFCDAKNLESITPDLLQFKVLGMSTESIEKGTILDYQLKIHGLPKKWKTLIEQWDPPNSFVDTQLEGPYSLWHHTHQFISMHNGTMMNDTVIYQPPLGPFGRLANMAFIRKDIEAIFNYRRKIIFEKFGT
jgi:ligand-binding SRPBCC domain-containing protein